MSVVVDDEDTEVGSLVPVPVPVDMEIAMSAGFGFDFGFGKLSYAVEEEAMEAHRLPAAELVENIPRLLQVPVQALVDEEVDR
jgi:hypothetical protein